MNGCLLGLIVYLSCIVDIISIEQYCATVLASETTGIFGYFALAINEGTSQFSFEINFDLYSIDNVCDISVYGLNFQISTYWNTTDSISADFDNCGQLITGGNYDPNFACSDYSQNIDDDCIKLNRTTSSDYYYNCNTSIYDSGNYASCEVGDLSGKFGPAFPIPLSKLISSQTFTDFYPPYNLNYDGSMKNSEYMWSSVVFRCGDSTNRPIVCAQFSDIDLSSCESALSTFYLDNSDVQVSQLLLNYAPAVITSIFSTLVSGIIVGALTMYVISLNRNKTVLLNRLRKMESLAKLSEI